MSSARARISLTPAERRAIIAAAESTFLKLSNLYLEVLPIFQRYGFKPPSAGVVSRDTSEQIEEQITLHCSTFSRGEGFADLARYGERWEVKICKGRRLTINQSARINGENYIVVNYSSFSNLRRIWILWAARDEFFTARKGNLNLRTVIVDAAQENAEVIHEVSTPPQATSAAGLRMAKASLSSAPGAARKSRG